jgi:adenine-specific DNA-methyltransferase
MARTHGAKSTEGGRPPVRTSGKKLRVSLSLSPGLHSNIDSSRCYRSRPKYVEASRQGTRAPYGADAELHRKGNGSVYTPAALAKYVGQRVASLFVSELASKYRNANEWPDSRDWRIIDPACGEGELLSAVWEGLVGACRARRSMLGGILEGVNATDILCGIDIDARALRRAKRRLGEINKRADVEVKAKLLKTNSLFPFNCAEPQAGWERVRQTFDAVNGFDVVIANPPWGADVSAYRHLLGTGRYSMYRGQFDTADLFLELALNICKLGGFIGYIIPDSLFKQEREKLRSVLLERTRIRLVARLGERVFNQVNRACAVIICQKCRPHPRTKSICLRLTPDVRKRILAGELSFAEAEKRLGHNVPQNRFILNPGNQFDIDVTVSEHETLRKLRRGGVTFRKLLSNTRGVELSKHGRVVRCARCGNWQPRPNGEQALCKHCREPMELLNLIVESVIAAGKVNGYVPFIVGECVQRYLLGPSLWIDPGKQGLNYKGACTYKPPKLLVRKTGVGISATIDYSTAYTNQVVYIFKLQPNVDTPVTLETCLGILNSRLMYYYLVKTHGETEWRSHPYITQQQILDLPLPFGPTGKDIDQTDIAGIHRAVKRYCTANRGIPPEVDAKIERHVANLFGATRQDYETIYATLENVQALLPVRALKSVPLEAIFHSKEP